MFLAINVVLDEWLCRNKVFRTLAIDCFFFDNSIIPFATAIWCPATRYVLCRCSNLSTADTFCKADLFHLFCRSTQRRVIYSLKICLHETRTALSIGPTDDGLCRSVT